MHRLTSGLAGASAAAIASIGLVLSGPASAQALVYFTYYSSGSAPVDHWIGYSVSSRSDYTGTYTKTYDDLGATAFVRVYGIADFLSTGPQALNNLELPTVRWVADTVDATYWVAVSEKHGVCLISRLTGPGQFAAMTCQSPALILEAGLALQMTDQTRALRAYFLPTGYEQDVAGYSRVANQLVVGDATKASSSLELVPNNRAEDASTLKLPDFEAAKAGTQ